MNETKKIITTLETNCIKNTKKKSLHNFINRSNSSASISARYS